MVTNEIRSVRAHDVLGLFMNGSRGCVFFTLTTPDVVDLCEIRRRWRKFRHELFRDMKRRRRVTPKYVMNYEVHPGGHGWHIHSVINCYVDLRRYLPLIRKCGFGRVDVRRVNSEGVADYLTKHALKAYAKRTRNAEKGVSRSRLVNASRGLPVLSDYHYESARLAQERRFLRLLNKSSLKPSFLECAGLARLAASSGCRSIFDVLWLYRQTWEGAHAVAETASAFVESNDWCDWGGRFDAIAQGPCQRRASDFASERSPGCVLHP